MKEALMEIGQRGQAIYDQQFRAKAEKENRGKFLVLDVNSGDFEIDSEDLIASERLLARRPDSVLFGVRIGSPAAYCLGGDTRAGRNIFFLLSYARRGHSASSPHSDGL